MGTKLNFKGKRLMDQIITRWFGQVPKDIKEKENDYKQSQRKSCKIM